ncbi:MAG: hypothetical protein KF812_00690 [Fimbriimonadaceae bacterium]|nr:hypothetical protein [Fimbriimonadaceae bacterium]
MKSRLLCAILSLGLIAASLAQPGGGSPTLSFVPSLTNWTGNADATDKNTFPSLLPAVEGVTYKIVYEKGGTATVSISFHNNNPTDDFEGVILVQDARYIHDTEPWAVPWGAPPPVTIPDTLLSADDVALNVPINQNGSATLAFAGLPAFVTKGHIQCTLRIEGNFGVQVPGGNPSPWNGQINFQTAYITFDDPTGVMDPVWTEMLDMSCTFAQEESAQADVIREVTQGLYFGHIFAYNLGTTATLYLNFTNQKYRLKAFLTDRQSNGIVPGNCYDINGFLTILIQSQGVSASGRVVQLQENIESENEESIDFFTNLFCPVGSDATNNDNYYQIRFAVHYQSTSVGSVNDGAAGYLEDLSGFTYMNPAWLWNPSGSWQTFNDPKMNGLTYRKFISGVDTWSVPSGLGFPVVTPGALPALEGLAETTWFAAGVE